MTIAAAKRSVTHRGIVVLHEPGYPTSVNLYRQAFRPMVRQEDLLRHSEEEQTDV